MAIEIYDKATVVQKGDTFYYLVKYGSKNSFTLPHQRLVDENFRPKWNKRMTRDSGWHVVAISNEAEYKADKISQTYWNSPTSEVYGQIRFGNKTNIALFFAKQRKAQRWHIYERMDEVQQEMLAPILARGNTSEWTIHLNSIPESKAQKDTIKYCGNEIKMTQFNALTFLGNAYWNLNNL